MKTYLCLKLIFWKVEELECLQNMTILNRGDGNTPFDGIYFNRCSKLPTSTVRLWYTCIVENYRCSNNYNLTMQDTGTFVI
jgi:hypothetical protein